MTLERLVVPEKTIHDQRRAADPAASAWVSANAGAGKTKVLTDRVLRLLLAGSPPGRILCLTFTKAAAANMAIRVFERLGRWVTLDDAALAAELENLEGCRPGRDRLRLARRLFARAVETPGGLKIETIHAFCERILHMVPFEANVPARFAVLDESQSAELLREATKRVLAEAAEEADDALADAFTAVSLEAAGDTLAKLVREAVCRKDLLAGPDTLTAALASLREALRLPEGVTSAAVETEMLAGGIPAAEWPAIGAALLESDKSTDRERAAAFAAATAAPDPAERLKRYRSVFFTKEGEPRSDKTIVTKQVDPGLKARLLDEQARLAALDEQLKAARAWERTAALLRLARAIRQRIDAEKRRLGALDFDDLIDRTLDLLRRGDTGWVLYKLDRGIDHVLIDEAQDTNPEQWEILRLITADFHAGEGAARDRARTVFAVGDPKQSIYGFQGAEPRKFEESRRHWRGLTQAGGFPFEDVPLTVSFRSVEAVLRAVDAVFTVREHFRGLSFDDDAVGTVHQSARPGIPGLVEVWPTERPHAAEEPDAWTHPVDAVEASAPPVAVARRVANAVRTWTTVGDEWGRVWRPGDVLILVKKRSDAFRAVIRALKDAHVPVAGADRLDIGAHIAVQDLIAAGRAALLPGDDLTLACALKSPLVGFDDDDLVRLATCRNEAEPLAAAIRRHAGAGDAAARHAAESLDAWRRLAAVHGPFGFYAALLGPMGGRKALVARLGSEAGDAIDAFLCAAHAAEEPETPSLTTFLAGFEGSDRQVKRDPDAIGDEVRVMTVHGAKGLEAPLVVLIDGCQVYGPGSALIPLTGNPESGLAVPVWSPGKAFDSAAIAAAREECRGRELEEHNRLLYVAMTRAKDRLVIAPYATNAKETPAEAWCEMVRRGLVESAGGLVRAMAPYGEIDVWRHDGDHVAPPPREAVPLPPAVALPTWLNEPVLPEPEPPPPIRPSGALGAADRAARPGDGPFAPDARLRGTLIHALVERLPGVAPERRAGVARAYVAARAPRLAEAERARIAADALGVLDHPDLAALFGAGSRAEVPVAGRVPLAEGAEPSPVSGQIDRLVVTDDEILFADFKTTMRPPGPDAPVPAAHLAQLALYRSLLMDVYPGRPVRAFLVWTSGPLVREIAAEMLDAALGFIKAA